MRASLGWKVDSAPRRRARSDSSGTWRACAEPHAVETDKLLAETRIVEKPRRRVVVAFTAATPAFAQLSGTDAVTVFARQRPHGPSPLCSRRILNS